MTVKTTSRSRYARYKTRFSDTRATVQAADDQLLRTRQGAEDGVITDCGFHTRVA